MNTTPPQQQISMEQALAQAHAHWNAGQADQAERLCQHVLAIWPGQSDASHLMGLMAHAYGNLPVAIDHLQRACQAPRAPATYLSNLAEMCRQAGRLAEAEAAGRRAIAIDHGLVAGWNNLGIILQEAGKLDESLTCLEQVVALKPDYPEAQNNLANTLKRLGRLSDAKNHYEAALRLAPHYAEALSNLSNLATDMGQSDEALAYARKAIDINPRLADAYINAAAAEQSRGNDEETLRWVDKLLAFNPQHIGGLLVRTVPLRHLDRLEEASEAARRAVTLAPENGEAHVAMGEALQALGRTDEALAAYDRAAKLPGLALEKAMVNRGICLIETGEAAAARVVFEQVLALFPRSVSAWFNLSDLVTFQAGDPAIAAMEALLTPTAMQARNDRIALHFALGKAWLDCGNAERAFHHFQEGNRQKRATLNYDPDATARWVQSIADAFPAAVFAGSVGGAVEVGDDLPVFIIGMPRSGSTLVEQVLASHAQVQGGGELSLLSRIVQRSGHYPAIIGQLTQAGFESVGRQYIDHVRALSNGKRRFLDKMPSNFLHAGLIARSMPKARIIHVRRNAADTCFSCYTKLFTREQLFTYDLAELGRFYMAYERLMAHWRSVLPPDRFIEVNYEELVGDFEPQARRLINFLGLNWDPACIDFHKTRRIIRTASVNQAREPLFTRSIGRAGRYAAHLGPLLAALGIEGVPVAAEKPAKATKRSPRPAKEPARQA